jgi:hypothetical protein
MSWVFYVFEPWPIVIGHIINPSPNLEAYVCFQKLKQMMHEGINLHNIQMHEQYVQKLNHINNIYKWHIENKYRPNNLKHNNQIKKQSLVHGCSKWSCHSVTCVRHHNDCPLRSGSFYDRKKTRNSFFY